MLVCRRGMKSCCWILFHVMRSLQRLFHVLSRYLLTESQGNSLSAALEINFSVANRTNVSTPPWLTPKRFHNFPSELTLCRKANELMKMSRAHKAVRHEVILQFPCARLCTMFSLAGGNATTSHFISEQFSTKNFCCQLSDAWNCSNLRQTLCFKWVFQWDHELDQLEII